MDELSDSIAWASRDPQWVSKVLLMGLIALIPIVGWSLATERGGIGGGLNVARVYRMVAGNLGSALQHGLFALGAGVGVILCFIGVIFTAPYAHAVLAAVVRHYEQAAGALTGASRHRKESWT